ncbi:MAG: DUF4340 domain-containing protein [Steroidobacteraceae bacterium]
MRKLGSRGTGALLGAGVVILAIALWVSSRQPSAAPSQAGKLVLPGLEHALNSITEVRLSKADGTRTTLEKGKADWVIGERGFPADSSLVRKLLIHLASLKIVETKTSDPKEYSVIGVQDVTSPRAPGTRIELVEPGKTVSLIVGNPSGRDASFIRIDGAKQSLLVSPQVMPESDPRRWLDDTIVDLPQSRIEDVRVKPASGPAYTVMRDSQKQLDFTIPRLPRGRKLASVTVANPVANALASLTLDDVRKATALPAHPVSAVYHTFDGLTVELTGQEDGKSRYVSISAAASAKASKAVQAQAQSLDARFKGWQLEVLGYQYDQLFQPLDALLAKPAKPLKAKARKHSGPSVHRANTAG